MSNTHLDRAKILTEALPYIQRYNGKIVVVNCGGVAMDAELRDAVATDITMLRLVGIKVVHGSEDLLLVTQAGILIRTHVDTIRTAGRATQGVIVMRFKEEGDRVISLALADRGEESTNSEENVENAPASGQDEIEAAEQESIEEL